MKTPRRALRLMALALMLSASSRQASAQSSPDALFVAAGAELWSGGATGGRGYLLAEYQRSNLWRDSVTTLTYNTDTVQVSLDRITLAEGFHLGAMLKGQYLFGGLLADQYVRGEDRFERGFAASYVQSLLYAKLERAPHFLSLEVGGRRWDFRPLEGQTAPELTLPPDAWVFEPRLRYTYWGLVHDRAMSEAHRHGWRVRGFAIGAELGVDLRDQRAPWGARDAARFDPVDLRNTGQGRPLIARAWARGGAQLSERVRLQGALFLGWGHDEDDLTRARIGGLNPYVVPMAGMPWASFLASRYGVSELSAHVLVLPDRELGVRAHAMVVPRDELLRLEPTSGPLELEALLGASLFADWRFGQGWQLEASVGASPGQALLAPGVYLSGFLSIGKQIF